MQAQVESSNAARARYFRGSCAVSTKLLRSDSSTITTACKKRCRSRPSGHSSQREDTMSSIFTSDALAGEVALVTGASRGIGAAIAACWRLPALQLSVPRPARLVRTASHRPSATPGGALCSTLLTKRRCRLHQGYSEARRCADNSGQQRRHYPRQSAACA